MNILFTSDLSGMGGGETSLVNLISIFKKKHNVYVLCAKEGRLNEILKDLQIEVSVFNYRDKRMLIKNIARIRKLVNVKCIDIIHSNDPLTSVLMYFSTIGMNVRNYWTCHGQWYDFVGIKKYLIAKSNLHIFCVSTAVEESLKRMGFKNTSVSYLGIPLEKYSNTDASTLRNQYGIDSESIMLGTIGRFQKIKGQLKMVKAVKKLVDDGIDVVYFLIGGCIYNNFEENEYYQAIIDYIQKNKLEDVIILTGEKSNISQIMHELQLLIIPSDNESFGMVAIEALASGLPIITTPNDGVSEIMLYNEKFVTETNDADGLYKLVKKYISSKSIQDEAIKFAASRKYDFEIEKIVDKYESIFAMETSYEKSSLN